MQWQFSTKSVFYGHFWVIQQANSTKLHPNDFRWKIAILGFEHWCQTSMANHANTSATRNAKRVSTKVMIWACPLKGFVLVQHILMGCYEGLLNLKWDVLHAHIATKCLILLKYSPVTFPPDPERLGGIPQETHNQGK